MTTSKAMRRWQIALIGGGVAVLMIAAVQLLTEIPPTRYLGIAAWLLAALVIHDGILAFGVLAASVLARRLKLPVPFAVVIIVQGAVVVAAIVTTLVLPAPLKQAIGTANPSILPLDYLGNLALFYVGLTGVTALVVGVYLGVRRLRARQPRTR